MINSQKQWADDLQEIAGLLEDLSFKLARITTGSDNLHLRATAVLYRLRQASESVGDAIRLAAE